MWCLRPVRSAFPDEPRLSVRAGCVEACADVSSHPTEWQIPEMDLTALRLVTRGDLPVATQSEAAHASIQVQDATTAATPIALTAICRDPERSDSHLLGLSGRSLRGRRSEAVARWLAVSRRRLIPELGALVRHQASVNKEIASGDDEAR